ncbi:MAG: LysE family translocator [Hyphomicrobiales bacterium]
MTLELYLSYVVACFVVLAVPGPTILLVISYALSQGRRAALSTVIGVGLGDAIAVTVSLAGLGALMATSATPSRCSNGWRGLPDLSRHQNVAHAAQVLLTDQSEISGRKMTLQHRHALTRR